jgi:Putative  PD-(D/E)XK family member, (DUF4420)
MSLDSAWKELEGARAYSSIRRVDATHPGDLFVALDANGERGLVLLSDTELQHLPALKSLGLECVHLADGKWQTCIWLRAAELQVLFSTLCEEMVSASRDVPAEKIGEFVYGRLMRWRRLFELADGGVLRSEEIRGLIGELLIILECFRIWPYPDVIAAWGGPLGAPQDFAFAGLLIETKAVGVTALRVRISSEDQLDAPYASRLMLAVVRLASVGQDHEGSFSLPELVTQISLLLEPFEASRNGFLSRLAAAGYVLHPEYDLARFRCDAINYFAVQDGFPRIRRGDLMPGINRVTYDLELAAIAAFERTLG